MSTTFTAGRSPLGQAPRLRQSVANRNRRRSPHPSVRIQMNPHNHFATNNRVWDALNPRCHRRLQPVTARNAARNFYLGDVEALGSCIFSNVSFLSYFLTLTPPVNGLAPPMHNPGYATAVSWFTEWKDAEVTGIPVLDFPIPPFGKEICHHSNGIKLHKG